MMIGEWGLYLQAVGDECMMIVDPVHAMSEERFMIIGEWRLYLPPSGDECMITIDPVHAMSEERIMIIGEWRLYLHTIGDVLWPPIPFMPWVRNASWSLENEVYLHTIDECMIIIDPVHGMCEE